MIFSSIVVTNSAAIILSLLSIINSRRYASLKISGNRLFISMLCLTIASSVLWISSYVYNYLPIKHNTATYTINLTVNILLYAVTAAFCHVSFLYFYGRLNSARTLPKKTKWLVYSPLIIILGMCVANFFVPVFFSLNPVSFEYKRLAGHYVLLAYSLLITLLVIIFAVQAKAHRKEFLIEPMVFFAVCIILSRLIETLFHGLSISTLGMALGLTAVYIAVQSRFYSRDFLSGLLTRSQLDSQLEREIEGSHNKQFVGIMLDVDGFKIINDTYGHSAGDDAIRIMGEALLHSISNTNYAYRYAGDEFVVIMQISDRAEIFKFIEKLKTQVETISKRKAICFELAFSYGYAFLDTKRDTARTFISRMDSTMYDDKRRKFASEKNQESRDAYYDNFFSSLHLSDIKESLDQGQFEVWYQPQMNHSDKTVIGAEALIRWNHPQVGIISPAIFIPVFERNGFVYELDKFTWRTVCRSIRTWLDNGDPVVPVSINISRIDLMHDELVREVSGILKSYNIPKELIHLEITESAFSAGAHVVNCVNNFIEEGFYVAVDDFGSGYSSLSLLKDVPAHELKLDLRFFQQTHNKDRNKCILQAIINMAEQLKMSVIAEGIETVDQADFLASLGCYCIQGFLYSRTLPKNKFESYIKTKQLQI